LEPLLTFTVIFSIATASFYLFELHFLRLKEVYGKVAKTVDPHVKMRKPTSPVAYALLIGNEGVSFTLAPAVSSFMQ